jgi:geranylgeranyl diphosphate synthase type II
MIMTESLAFEKKLKQYQVQVDEYLRNSILKPYRSIEPKILAAAMDHALFAGGKRIRPILVLMTAELFNFKTRDFLPLAAAVEVLHTYSLIHDDLPAMDDDDLRRGQPTLHRKYNEAIAILAGDTMQTLAYEVLLQLNQKKFSAQKIIAAIKIFAKSSGYLGMAGGQVLDVNASDEPQKKVSPKALMQIHHLKTGALMQGCVLSAATLAGASKLQYKKLESFSKSFGLIFQIKDDILDITGDETKLGKPVGSDARNQKTTFPDLWGMKACEKLMLAEETKSLKNLASFGARAEAFRHLLKYIITREN